MPLPKVRLSYKQCFTENDHISVLHQNLSSSALHSHEFFEIEIILKGSGTHIINSKSYDIQRGTVWISTPADFHEINLDGEAEYWTIIFDETIISPIHMQEIFQSDLRCLTVAEDVLRRLDIVTQLIDEEHLHNGNVRPLMEYILDIVIPQKAEHEILAPVPQAILYIETFFRSSPSLAVTAEQVGLSPNYFSNIFKKETGETYISYLTRRKVMCAMMLLEKGISVADACFESGFGSLSGFLQSFKKITGVSPNEYQKKHSLRV